MIIIIVIIIIIIIIMSATQRAEENVIIDLVKIRWNNDGLIKIPWNDYALIKIPWIYMPLDHRLRLVDWYTMGQDKISSKERTYR